MDDAKVAVKDSGVVSFSSGHSLLGDVFWYSRRRVGAGC